MQEILDILFQRAPEMSPKLRQAAGYILDNPATVAVSSMRALAAKAGVTPPTMVRLAKNIGFKNYDSMRAVFQKSLIEPDYRSRATSLQAIANLHGESELISELGLAAGNNIQRLFQNVTSAELDEVADLIRHAPTAYLVAAGAPHWIAAYMQYLGRMVLPHLRMPRTSGVSLIDGLFAISEGDVVLMLSFSPYAKQSIEAARFAKSRGAQLIYLTDSLAAPMAAEADNLLLVSTSSPQFFPSMVAAMAAIETIIAVIVARAGSSTIRDIARFDKIWRESNALD